MTVVTSREHTFLAVYVKRGCSPHNNRTLFVFFPGWLSFYLFTVETMSVCPLWGQFMRNGWHAFIVENMNSGCVVKMVGWVVGWMILWQTPLFPAIVCLHTTRLNGPGVFCSLGRNSETSRAQIIHCNPHTHTLSNKRIFKIKPKKQLQFICGLVFRLKATSF